MPDGYLGQSDEDWRQQSSNPAAPYGLQQAADAGASYDPRNPDPQNGLGRNVANRGYLNAGNNWLTGGNAAGTGNGWDSAFMEEAAKQYDQVLKSMDKDPNAFEHWLESGTATGVVTWGERRKVGDNDEARFGDVWSNGQRVGNVFDDYKETDANLLIAPFVLDGKTIAKVGTERDETARNRWLGDHVEQARESMTEALVRGKGAREFQADVDKEQRDLEEGSGKNWLIAGAAFAGGTLAAGAGFFTGGTTLPVAGALFATGAAAAGGAAYLNQDQLTELGARAIVQSRMADEKFGGFQGFTEGLSAWSQVGMRLLNPISNTVQGITDASIGTVGDGREDFYSYDENGNRRAPKFAQLADVAGVFADSVLQFTNPLGLAMYSATMSGNIVGEVGTLGTTGESFDIRRGGFHDHEGVKQNAAAWLNVGIDAVQLGMAHGIMQGAASARAMLPGAAATEAQAARAANTALAGEATGVTGLKKTIQGKLPAWAGGLKEGESAVTVAGSRYVMNAEGEVTRKGFALASLAPSEFTMRSATALKVRASMSSTERAAAKELGTLADDYYRAAVAITSGESSRFGTALLNAFGEGAEEAAQAVLEPISHDAKIDPQEVARSWAYGAAAGLGMGLGATFGGPSSTQKLYGKVLAKGLFTNERLPYEVFERLPLDQQRSLAKMDDKDVEQTQATFDALHRAFGVSKLDAGTMGYEALTQGIENYYEQIASSAGDATGSVLRIQPFNDQDKTDADGNNTGWAHDPYVAQLSAWRLVREVMLNAQSLGTKIATLRAQLESEQKVQPADEAEAAKHQSEVARLTEMLDDAVRAEPVAKDLAMKLSDMHQAFAEAVDAQDMAMATRVTDAMNETVRQAYFGDFLVDGNEPTADEIRAAHDAAALLYARDPNITESSFTYLMPQVSRYLTNRQMHGVIQVHDSLINAMNADYDGDNVRRNANIMLDRAAKNRLRSGAQYLAEVEEIVVPYRSPQVGYKVKIAAPESDDMLISWINRSKDLPAVQDAITQLQDILWAKYAPAVRNNKPLLGLVEKLGDDLLAGNTGARASFLDGLATEYASEILAVGENEGLPQWPWISQQISAKINQTQLAWAANKPEYEYEPGSTTKQVKDTPAAAFVVAEAQQRAANLGFLLQLIRSGTSALRGDQAAHYTAYTASTEQAETDAPLAPEVFDDIVRFYEGRSSGRARSAADDIVQKNSTVRHTFDDLRRALEESGQDFGRLNSQALLLMAMTRAQDFEVVNGTPRPIKADVTFLQMLLRRNVNIDRAAYADVAEANEDVMNKLRLLESMTHPRNRDGGHSTAAQEAAFEVFADVPLFQLLGEDAMYLGLNTTMRTLRMELLDMDRTGRQNRLERWKRKPAYLGRINRHNPPYGFDETTSGNLTPYRIMVDIVEAVANKAAPQRREQSDRIIEAFETGFDSLRKGLENFRNILSAEDAQAFEAMTKHEQMLALINGDPSGQLARQVAALIPQALKLGSFFMQADGTVNAAEWVTDMLVMEPQAAVTSYWVHTVLGEYLFDNTADVEQNAADIVDEVNEDEAAAQAGDTRARKFSRLQTNSARLLYRTAASDPTGVKLMNLLRKINTAVANGTSLRDLMDTVVNTPSFRGDFAEITPFVDDVALTDTSTERSWQPRFPGAEQREAILNFEKTAKRHSDSLAAAFAVRDSDTMVANKIINYVRSLNDTSVRVDQDAQVRAQQLARVIENAQNIWTSAGPSLTDNAAAVVQSGIHIDHNKGKADPAFAGFGAIRVLAEGGGAKVSLFRAIDDVTAVSEEDVILNPSLLANRALRIQMRDGSVIEWTLPSETDTPTGHKLDRPRADLLNYAQLLADPSTAGFVKQVLGLTVRDQLQNGQLGNFTFRHDKSSSYLQHSLLELLDRSDFAHLFPAPGESLTRNQALEIISLVEGGVFQRTYGQDELTQTKGFYPLQQMIHEVLTAYTHSLNKELTSNAQAEEMRDYVYTAVARTVMLAADQYQQGQLSLDTMKEALKQNLKKRFGTPTFSILDSVDSAEARKVLMHEMARAKMDNLVEQYAAITRRQQFASSAEEHARLQAQMDQLERSIAQYNQDLTNNFDDVTVDAVLKTFDIDSAAEIAAVQKKAILDYLGAGRINYFTDEEAEVWQLVRDELQSQHFQTTGEDRLPPEVWPTLSRAAATVFLAERARMTGTSVSLKMIETGEWSTVARSFDTTWSSLIDNALHPEVLESMAYLARQAGYSAFMDPLDAAEEIERRLFNKDRLKNWSPLIVRQNISNRDAMLASPVDVAVAIPGNLPSDTVTLMRSLEATYDLPADPPTVWTLNPAQMVDDTSLSLMEGRFVKRDGGLLLRYTNEAGQQETYDLFNDPELGEAWGNLADPETAQVFNSGYVVVTGQRIMEAVEKARLAIGGWAAWDIQVTGFDPRQRPEGPQWANNIYFNGVGRNTIFANDGVYQTLTQKPLDATKKQIMAFVPTPHLDYRLVHSIETGGDPIFDQLVKKARLIMEREYDFGRLQSSDFNFLMQVLRARHMVQVMQDGEAKLVTVDEAIADQSSETPRYGGYSLVPISENLLNTALGDTTGRSNRIEELDIDQRASTPTVDVSRYVDLGIDRIGEAGRIADTLFKYQRPHSTVAGPAHRESQKVNVLQPKLERWQREQDEALSERAKNPDRFSGHREANQSLLDDAYNADRVAELVPGPRQFGLPNDSYNALARSVVQNHMERNEGASLNTVWLFRQNRSGDLTKGWLGAASFNADVPIGESAVYGDQVIFDLADFYETGLAEAELFNLAKGVVRKFAARGVTVHLVSTQGGTARLRAELREMLVDELDYDRQSSHTFVPITSQRFLTQTERAMEQTLIETRGVSANRLRFEFRSSQFTQANENSSHWNDEGQAEEQWPILRMNVLSKRPDGFSEPQTTQQKSMAREKVLALLNTEAGMDHAVKLAEDSQYDARLYLTKLRDQLADVDGWPKKVGEEFGFRYFDVLVGPNDTVYLGRQGFKSLVTKEVMEQAAMGVGQTEILEGVPGTGVAIAPAKRDDSLTTNTGIVRGVDRGPQGGGQLLLAVNVSAIGGKGVGEKDGMKHTFNEMPRGLHFPQRPIAEGHIINIASGKVSGRGKEALFGVGRNFRNWFLAVGVDFRDDMIEFVRGQRPTEQNFEAEWAITQRVLRSIADADFGVDPAIMAAALRGDSFYTNYASMVGTYLQRELGMAETEIGFLATSDSTESVNDRLGTIFMAALMTDGVKLEHLQYTLGIADINNLSTREQARLMPQIFTDALDDYRAGTPAALRSMLFDRINAKLGYVPGVNDDYMLAPNWDFVVKMDDNGTPRYVRGELKITDLVLDDAHPDLMVQSELTNTKSPVSLHAAAQASVLFRGGIAHRGDFERVSQMISKEGVPRFGEGGADLFVQMQNLYDPNMPASAQTDSERNWIKEALRRHALYHVPLSRTDWTDDDKTRFDQMVADVSQVLYGRLMKDEIEYFVRLMVGARGIDSEVETEVEGVDNISGEAARQILEVIAENIADNKYPTYGSVANPLIDAYALQLILDANKARGENQWAPAAAIGKRKVLAKMDLTSWVHSAFGQMAESDAAFDSIFRVDLDGAWATYSDLNEKIDELPPSVSAAINLKLLDPMMQEMATIASLDPQVRAQLTSILGLDGTRMTLESIMRQDVNQNAATAELVSANAIAERLNRIKVWKTKNKVGFEKKGKVRDYLSEGAWYSKRATGTHKILRGLTNLRLGLAMFNPALMVAAIPESQVRNLLDNTVSLLQGSATGAVGRGMAKVGASRYTPEQLAQVESLVGVLGNDPRFMSMIYDELMYAHLIEPGEGRLGRFLERFAAAGSRLQDPTWGMFAKTVAKRYVETALAYLEFDSDNVITFDRFIAEMNHNPKFLADNSPSIGISAQSSALNAVAQIRSTRTNIVGKAVRGIYEPMTESGQLGGAVNLAGHLLKWPLVFTNYTAGAAMFLTGTAGIGDWVAATLHGRKSMGSTLKSWITGQEAEEAKDYDMSDILEGLDLTRSFLRAGVTWSGYMAYLLMGGIGLSGEDKEAKRRRLLAAYYGAPLQYDPRKMGNDFRNSGLINIDGLPGPLESIGKMFSGGSDWIAPHWIVRQFISPIVGMERFMQTGDLDQIKWGFQDAVSAIPLSVTRLVDDAFDSATELQKMAEKESLSNSEDSMNNTNRFIIALVGTYERMMMESSFVNTVRNGMDAYDRDPWVRVQTDEHGRILRDDRGNPLPAEMLKDYKDPVTGEIRQSYDGRSFWDAQLHQYAENNTTFSFFANLFTGHNPLGGDGSFSRGNMAVKQKEIPLDSVGKQEAKGLFLKAFDAAGGAHNLSSGEEVSRLRNIGFQQTGQYATTAELSPIALSHVDKAGNEILTTEGGKAMYRGLYKGTVDFESGSLQGVYVTREMRDQIAGELFQDLIKEGLSWGMDEVTAKSRARRIWFGRDPDNPDTKGLRDIVYSDMVPSKQTARYNQLNTTFIMGPDGKPYATGIRRDSWLEALGVNFVGTGLIRNTDGGMGVDERFNSTDEISNVNTGLRALERNKGEKIEPNDAVIEKALAKTYPANSGTSSGGYKKGSGGGYSSYGSNAYFTRMNPFEGQRAVYGNSIPFLNTSNPIIRRADVRRERVWSERGRLKQWQ